MIEIEAAQAVLDHDDGVNVLLDRELLKWLVHRAELALKYRDELEQIAKYEPAHRKRLVDLVDKEEW